MLPFIKKKKFEDALIVNDITPYQRTNNVKAWKVLLQDNVRTIKRICNSTRVLK